MEVYALVLILTIFTAPASIDTVGSSVEAYVSIYYIRA